MLSRMGSEQMRWMIRCASWGVRVSVDRRRGVVVVVGKALVDLRDLVHKPASQRANQRFA